MTSSAESLVWVDAEASPFGLRCLDVRPFCWKVVAVTSDPAVAEQYAMLRASNGEQHRGALPASGVTTPCALSYGSQHRNFKKEATGPVWIAQTMDDKWDIFQFGEYLYFARSWTGELRYVARIVLTADFTAVTEIVFGGAAAGEWAEPAVGNVDFLIKSHLHDLIVPHTIPAAIPESEKEQIAAYSFGMFGRRASFATYENATGYRI